MSLYVLQSRGRRSTDMRGSRGIAKDSDKQASMQAGKKAICDRMNRPPYLKKKRYDRSDGRLGTLMPPVVKTKKNVPMSKIKVKKD